jgi:hypothetical protein
MDFRNFLADFSKINKLMKFYLRTGSTAYCEIPQRLFDFKVKWLIVRLLGTNNY